MLIMSSDVLTCADAQILFIYVKINKKVFYCVQCPMLIVIEVLRMIYAQCHVL